MKKGINSIQNINTRMKKFIMSTKKSAPLCRSTKNPRPPSHNFLQKVKSHAQACAVDVLKERAVQRHKHRSNTAKSIVAALDRANASLSLLWNHVRGFPAFLSGLIDQRSQYYGDTPAEAIQKSRGRVRVLERFGFSNVEGTPCIVIHEDPVILITSLHVSHDLEIWYHRALSQNDFEYLEHPSILNTLTDLALPDYIIRELVFSNWWMRGDGKPALI